MPADPSERGASPQEHSIRIRPLGGGARIKDFLRVADHVYADDPAWIPPLRLERRLHLSRQNPFTQHAQWQGWVAWRGGQPVGRITAQVDALHRERYGPDTGHFGFLDAIDDQAVFQALTRSAEEWLASRGTRRITGPFNLSINQECGLLVDGFETPPTVMMPHGRPWFGPRLEEQGYTGARDLLAYEGETAFTPPPALEALTERFRDRIRVRPLDQRRRTRDLECMRELFNDAWAKNYGFVPFTAAEFKDISQILRLFVDNACVQIAELDGEPVAFNVGMPDLNQAIRDLDGRLFPLGWLRLLRRLRRHEVTHGRVPLMGVRRDLQNTPVGTAVIWGTMRAVQNAMLARNIRQGEMSWILEDNQGMRKIAQRIGGVVSKRYRLYEKTL